MFASRDGAPSSTSVAVSVHTSSLYSPGTVLHAPNMLEDTSFAFPANSSPEVLVSGVIECTVVSVILFLTTNEVSNSRAGVPPWFVMSALNDLLIPDRIGVDKVAVPPGVTDRFSISLTTKSGHASDAVSCDSADIGLETPPLPTACTR